jgi:thiamine pyrophosphate-dependent acetolactate synthase large subunit-like protein
LFIYLFIYLFYFLFSPRVPPTALAPNTRYEKMIEAFGGVGYSARTIPELRDSLGKAMADTSRSSIVNIAIDPMGQRKTQVYMVFFLLFFLFFVS